MFPGFTCTDAIAQFSAGQMRLTFQNGWVYDMNFGVYSDGTSYCNNCCIDVSVGGNILLGRSKPAGSSTPNSEDCTVDGSWSGTADNIISKDGSIICGYRLLYGMFKGTKIDGIITISWLDNNYNLRTKTGTLSLTVEP